MIKRFCLGVVLVGVVLVGGCVAVIGPWPTYGPKPLDQLKNYQDALAEVDKRAPLNDFTDAPGRLMAGWGSAELTPPIGTPLAGYGDRAGGPSTGVHDPIMVKALAVSDGVDTAIIIGSDMLVVTDNISNPVRERVAAATGISENAILFNASHTHSGPGAAMEGVVAYLFAGKYNEDIPELAISAFTKAILDAHANMKPARIANGTVDVPEHVRNRTRRDEPVDGSLRYLVVEQEGGERCIVVRYSAHATVLGGGNMEFSADYPGYLQRIMTEETGAECIFIGGAVGSTSPANSGEGDGFQRCENLGRSLVQKVLPGLENLKFKENVDIAVVGAPIIFPSYQIRLTKALRLSKFAPGLAGINDDAWVGAVRIGDVILAGLPADYNGSLAVLMAQWAEAVHEVELWMNSFNGDYIGYLSPDAVYFYPFDHPDAETRQDCIYEVQIMSWTGPQQEVIFNGIVKRMVERLVGAS